MTLSLSEVLEQIGQRAAAASRILSQATTAEKNEALLAIARRIEQETETILTANEADLRAGSGRGLSAAMLDRARLDPKRIHTIANSVREVVHLTDPTGEVLKEWSRPNGLKISKRRVPIGVIGIIYESRPNVTSDAASLCLKTGNAVILRGGSETIRSNMALAEAISEGCKDVGLPEYSVQLVPSTDRAAVTLMAQLDRYIHLIIPRGGRSLIEAVTSAARMPVIKHFDGICAAYVDRAADLPDGGANCGQREMPATRCLQRDRNHAGPRRDRSPFSSSLRQRPLGTGRRTTGRSVDSGNPGFESAPCD